MDPNKYNYSQKKTPTKFVFVMVFAFMWLFLCVWFSSQSVKFNYEINNLSSQRDRLKMQNRILELKLQTMMSTEKIANVAKEKYGFKSPGARQIFIIKKDTGFLEKIINRIKQKFKKDKKV